MALEVKPISSQQSENPFHRGLQIVGEEGLERIGSIKTISSSQLNALQKLTEDARLTHQDHRRTIYSKEVGGGEVVKIHTIAKDAILGEHYHPKKKELIFVSQAKEPVVMWQAHCNSGKDGVISKNMKTGDITNIQPGVVHAFKTPSSATLMVIADQKYQDGDTLPGSFKLSLVK